MGKMRYPLMIIASAVMFGLSPFLTQMSFAYGGNGFNVPFYSALPCLPIFFFLLKLEGGSLRTDRKTLIKIAILSLGSAGAVITLMCSYAMVPVGTATTLHFVYPVVVAFGLVLFFKEKLTVIKIAALTIAVGGIAVMSLEGGNVSPFGLFLALISGVIWAFYIVYMDKSGLSPLSAYLVGFYAALFNCVEIGAFGLITGNLNPFTSYKGWLFAFASALLGRVVGQVFFQMGIRGAGSLAAGILSTFEPITSVIVGILFMGESSSMGKLLGCLLVISGVCLTVYSDYREERAAREP